jgi:2-keto-4-pentenoate hydratase/2-oxohepta-3-ene-1,7-dioic acid hydratase in catechol pathway
MGSFSVLNKNKTPLISPVFLALIAAAYLTCFVHYSYATHLKEAGSKFNMDTPPPVFKKALISLNQSGEPVKIPDRQALVDCADNKDFYRPGHC